MSDDDLKLWKFIISIASPVLVVVSGLWGFIKYLQERKQDREVTEQELAWRKTRFIFELADDFEKDDRHAVVWRLLTYGTTLPRNSSLSRILGDETNGFTSDELELRYSIDNYLDFFDRLSHFVYVAGSLKISDLEVFGWYIAQIGETKEIREYAKSAGFDDVLRLSSDFHNNFRNKHWYKVFRKTKSKSKK